MAETFTIKEVKIIRFNPTTSGIARAETQMNNLLGERSSWTILSANSHKGKIYVVMGKREEVLEGLIF